ncbi:hypothetical protein [Burkholderia gladioli]|uniref:hypothetical protein n=1 Tax=Burkholderia gladioli TaxID=28095 RepID=UPI00164196C1|nr:hypothetical protein [Burkholderia gladioli]
MTFDLKYMEEATQRRLALSGGELVPLGFDELVPLQGKLREPIAFPLRIEGATVASTEFKHLRTAEKLNVKMELQSHLGSTVLGLVKGGWLPSGLILDEETLLLPDRCTVAALRSRFIGGQPKVGVPPDFLDFAHDKALKINPMLYAMEGTTGSCNPDASELSSLYDRAARKIGEALPKAVMFPSKNDALRGVIGLLRDQAQGFTARQRFLIKAAPLLATPIARKQLPDLWFQLLELADRHGVARASMLVCALVSASAAHPAMNPAMGVLKPRRQYTEKNAFNALADLRALDLLIAAGTDFPDKRVALLTEDRALALFWVGMQTHNHRRDGTSIRYAMNPHKAMFARLSDQELQTVLKMLTNSTQ